MKSKFLILSSMALALPIHAATVDLGSQSGNAITSEVLAYGWIRDDNAGNRHGGETAFIGTAGSQDFRAYVAYDLSGFSVGDTINSATVSLWSEGGNTFDANGPSTTDANSIGLNLTSLDEITGYGGGFGNNANTDVGGLAATFTNISGLYGATISTVTLNLDTMAINQQVDWDVTAAIQAAVTAGSSKLTFGVTSPDAIATGARNFFGFEGMDQGGPGGNIGPNLNVDFTAVPEPSTGLLFSLGGMAFLLRRRRK
ncbi:MAG: hypothetical protein ACI8XO_000390 [Verrucomicrobiales bacterium]|jgi:hypothetical protein